MVTARPWTASAIARFVLCAIVFFFCGSLLLTMLHHPALGHRADLRFYRCTAAGLGCAATSLIYIYRPWNEWNVLSRLGGYLLCLFAGLILGGLAQSTTVAVGPSVSQMIVAALSLQGAVLVLIPHFLQEQKLTWSEAFGFRNNRGQAVVMGLALGCIFVPVGMGLQWLSAEIMVHLPYFPLKPQQQESVQTLQMAVTWFNRVVLGVITIVLAPAAEEMVFRGILYPAIKHAGFPRLALWGTVLLFALIHFNLVTFLPLTLLALCLTLLYERTDNLLATITAHALFNAINFVLLYWSSGPMTRLK